MNKLILSTVLAALVAAPVSAKTVYYPKEYCAEILSSEYSTGGGDSSFNMFEILCKDAQGKYRTLVTSWVTVSGFLGFGRVAFDEVIELKPYDGKTLKSE
jgi:hypothetical protein